MKHLLLKLEPLIWLLFGNGIMIGTILLTGWLVVVAVGIPLGLVPEGALAFLRAQRLAGSLVGRALLFLLIALPLWKGAHHVRSLSIDFGGASRDPAVATLLYGIALVGSVMGLLAVIRL